MAGLQKPGFLAFSEQELLQDELSALQSARERHLNRISELEEEVKRTKEELELFQERASKEDEVAHC